MLPLNLRRGRRTRGVLDIWVEMFEDLEVVHILEMFRRHASNLALDFIQYNRSQFGGCWSKFREVKTAERFTSHVEAPSEYDILPLIPDLSTSSGSALCGETPLPAMDGI